MNCNLNQKQTLSRIEGSIPSDKNFLTVGRYP